MSDTLDFQRMFFGDAPPIFLVEIAIRTTLLFAYTLLIMRLVGQRGIAQLSIGEFTLLLALGSAVGDPMFYADVPLIHAMLVITLVAAFQILTNQIAMRSRKIAHLLDGQAIRIVAEGKLDEAGINAARLTHDEVYAELRIKGVEDMNTVRRAYLEQDGKISVFLFEDSSGHASKNILPENL